MKSILFYWGKGAETRVAIIKIIDTNNKKNEPIFLNQIAQTINLSHVAIMKHLSLLVEEGYVREVNPNGKPIFLELTTKGQEIAHEFQKQP